MKLSKLFTKTLREKPKDAVAASHIWLVRGGFIAQLSSGIYSFLPLGFRVLKNIENLIRQELDKIGALEVSMPILHPAEIWKKTGRWHEIGKELWKIKSHEGDEMVLSMTHEEAIAEMASHYISTFRDFPLLLNQFQVKFRDEERPRGGLLRLKEFIMQDAYSFDRSEKELNETYQKIFEAYLNIFKKLDLKVIPVEALPGIMGGGESHEFMLPADIGEDKVTFRENGNNFVEKRAIELGHTFKLGVKYSEPFNIYFEDENGKKKIAIMGSYGIGLDRLMAAVVEIHNDEKGIMWPESIAPYKVHLISLDQDEEADKVYDDLQKSGIDVLYDDREGKTAGEKFADADLIGCPIRIVMSKKTLEKDSVEIKKRAEKEVKLIPLDKALTTVL